jgi:Domain of unknown function (DUF4062)
MISVFLSSTLRDLRFERRAIRRALLSAGFGVTCMEDLDRMPNDPFRWSVDTVAKSDIYVLLIGERGGSLAYGGIGFEGMATYTHWELKWSRQYTARQLHYRLHRPFPDVARLNIGPEEMQEYEGTLAQRDENYWLAKYIWNIGRKIEDVYSATDLLHRVLFDVKSSVWRVYLRRASPARWMSRRFAHETDS